MVRLGLITSCRHGCRTDRCTCARLCNARSNWFLCGWMACTSPAFVCLLTFHAAIAPTVFRDCVDICGEELLFGEMDRGDRRRRGCVRITVKRSGPIRMPLSCRHAACELEGRQIGCRVLRRAKVRSTPSFCRHVVVFYGYNRHGIPVFGGIRSRTSPAESMSVNSQPLSVLG